MPSDIIDVDSHWDTSTKKGKMLSILDCMGKGIVSVHKIALATDLNPNTVKSYVAEILRTRKGEISSKTMGEILHDAFSNYKQMAFQAISILENAKTEKDKLKAIEVWSSVQKNQDDLMKKAGIYKEVKKIEITEEEIMQSRSGEQFVGLFIDFLGMKGIDPQEFFIYQERRARGEFSPIVVNGEDMPKSADPEDVYEQHRVERRKNREQKVGPDGGARMQQFGGRQLDARATGAQDIHIMKSLLLSGKMDDETERLFIENAVDTDVEEYLSMKKLYLDDECE